MAINTGDKEREQITMIGIALKRFPKLMKGVKELRSDDGFPYGQTGRVFFIHYKNGTSRAFKFESEIDLADKLIEGEEKL